MLSQLHLRAGSIAPPIASQGGPEIYQEWREWLQSCPELMLFILSTVG